MRWNPLVPELSVNDIVESLDFYVKGIGFTVLFTRDEPLFAYLDLNGAQLMLEEDHPETCSPPECARLGEEASTCRSRFPTSMPCARG